QTSKLPWPTRSLACSSSSPISTARMKVVRRLATISEYFSLMRFARSAGDTRAGRDGLGAGGGFTSLAVSFSAGGFHDVKQRSPSALGRRRFKHPLQRNDRHSQQATDLDRRNVAPTRRLVARVSAKVEVDTTSFGNGQGFRLVHHSNVLSISDRA